LSKRSRDKGLVGEREVKHAFQVAGFDARGTEGQGDHLVVCGGGVVLHIEVKRAETLRLPDWTRQAESEAAQGTLPLVIYRRSREPWRVSIKLDDLLALLVLLNGKESE
jgi:Holliday junction resolvase